MNQFLNKLPFANHAWFLYLRLLVRHFLEDDITQKAASLTYTTLLSIVPILTVLLVILSSAPQLEGIRDQIQHLVVQNLTPSGGANVSSYLDSFAQNSTNLSLVGIGFLFVTTIMTLITIETTFNQVWRVEENSGGIKSVVRYWLMITLGPVILSIAFLASNAVQSISFLNRQVAGYSIDWGVWIELLSAVFTILGFAGMYWFIPKVVVPKKNALIAGLVVGVLFEAVRRFFGVIMTNFTSYEAVYGAFAVLPILLMWIYTSWNLILLGVEISYTLTIFSTKETRPRHPLFSILDMLNLIYKNHQEGKSATQADLRGCLGRKELPKWNAYLNQLELDGLIEKTDSNKYILKKDLSTLTLWQFYVKMPYPLPIKSELEDLKTQTKDPWHGELIERLQDISNTGRYALGIALDDLLRNTKVRGVNDMIDIKNTPMYFDEQAKRQDFLGEHSASFNSNAQRMFDEAGNEIVIPKGGLPSHKANTTATIKSPPFGQYTRYHAEYRRLIDNQSPATQTLPKPKTASASKQVRKLRHPLRALIAQAFKNRPKRTKTLIQKQDAP